MKNSPIKVPYVLINLGQVKKIETDGNTYKYRIKDKMMLFCTVNGKSLYCMIVNAKAANKPELENAIKAKQTLVSEGMKTFEKFHEFESCSGSLCAQPKGFLFDAGRVISLTYSSDKWTGKKINYIHVFKKSPKLRVNKKKTQPTLLVLTGGNIQVKNEGIIG